MKIVAAAFGGFLIGAVIYSRGCIKLMERREHTFKKNLKYALKDMRIPDHKIVATINRAFEI